MARFIVIDGLDGCGKATQTELLKEALENMGKKVVKIDFPKYDSESSAPVRMYLNGELGNDPALLNPYMCGTFYAVDRFIQYVKDWKKYFDEDDNTIIIADRYLSANIIHQGGKIESTADRMEYIKWCYDLECNKAGLPVEDITIVLTITPELSQKLLLERYHGDKSKKDIHEGNIEYLNNCYYRLKETIEAINQHPLGVKSKWLNINCENYLENKVDTKLNIHKCIMKYVNKVLNNEEITEIVVNSVNSKDN